MKNEQRQYKYLINRLRMGSRDWSKSDAELLEWGASRSDEELLKIRCFGIGCLTLLRSIANAWEAAGLVEVQ